MLRALLALCLAALVGGGAACPAQAQIQTAAASFRAESLHAAFLLNFIRFTEWPPSSLASGDPVVVGVAGSRALEDELIALAERKAIPNRRIHVVRVRTVRDLEGCHVLFIHPEPRPSEESGASADELLAQVRYKPVLTISESPEFLAKGGIVNFYQGAEQGKLRFEIAPTTARMSGLILSSRLLALARIVGPKAPTTASR